MWAGSQLHLPAYLAQRNPRARQVNEIDLLRRRKSIRRAEAGEVFLERADLHCQYAVNSLQRDGPPPAHEVAPVFMV